MPIDSSNTALLVERLRVIHPEWSSFRDTQFEEAEIRYKQATIVKARELLAESALRTSCARG